MTYNFLHRTVHNNFCLARFILANKLEPEMYNKYFIITNLATRTDYILYFGPSLSLMLMCTRARTRTHTHSAYQLQHILKMISSVSEGWAFSKIIWRYTNSFRRRCINTLIGPYNRAFQVSTKCCTTEM
jgi:hypothetical protein